MKSNSRVLRGWRDFGVKATAIILTILLATQMVGTPAFASGALTNKQASEDIAATVDDTGVEPSGTEATDTTVPDEAAGAANEPAPADSTQATEEPVVETVESATEPATETPAADPAANTVLGTEPEPTADSGSEPAPAVEQNQLASIKLILADGTSITLSKDGNKIDDDTNPVDVPANEELKFTAAAPEGMQISAVKTFINGVESDPIAADENGEYTIAAEDVTDGLTVKVETSAVEGGTPSEGEEASTENAAEAGNEESTDPAAAEGESAIEESVTPESIANTATSTVKTMVSEISLFAAGDESGTVLVTVKKTNDSNYSQKVNLPLGSITSESATTAVADLGDLESYEYRDARVDNVEVISINQHGDTYYVTTGENQIAGIALDDTTDVVLYFQPEGSTYQVNYKVMLGNEEVTGDNIPGDLIGPETVNKGEDFSMSFVPDEGYNVNSVQASDSLNVSRSDNVYTIENVQSDDASVDLTIYVSEITEYNFTFSESSNTQITFNGQDYVSGTSDNHYQTHNLRYTASGSLTFAVRAYNEWDTNSKTFNKLVLTIDGVSRSISIPAGSQNQATTEFGDGISVIVSRAGYGSEYTVTIQASNGKKVRGDISISTNFKKSSSSEIWATELIGVEPLKLSINLSEDGNKDGLMDPREYDWAERNTNRSTQIYIKVSDGYDADTAPVLTLLMDGDDVSNQYSLREASYSYNGVEYDYVLTIPADSRKFNPKDIRIGLEAKSLERSYGARFEGEGYQSQTKSGTWSSGEIFSVSDDSGVVPERGGFVFQGWKLEGDSSGTVYKNGVPFSINDDVINYVERGENGVYYFTFVAQWVEADEADQVPYNINLYFANEDGEYGEEPSRTIQENGVPNKTAFIDADTLTQTLTELGYIPDGDWIADDSKNDYSVYVTADEVASIKIYYQRAVSVTFEPGGEGAASDQQSETVKIAINTSLNDFGETVPEFAAAEGWAFDGWRMEDDDELLSSNDVASTKIMGDTTFTAQWVEKEGTFRYHLVLPGAQWSDGAPAGFVQDGASEAGGKFWVDPAKYRHPDTITVTDKVPTCDGYVFLGWFDKARTTSDHGGTEAAVRNADDTFTYLYDENSDDNVYTLDALWASIKAEPKTVTYDGDEHGIDAATVEYNNKSLEEFGAGDLIKLVFLQYSETEGGGYSDTIPAKTNAGKYTIYVKATLDVDGKEVELKTSTTLEIAKRNVEFTGESGTRTYTGSAIKLTGVTTNSGEESGLVNGHAHNVVALAEGTDAGRYEGSITLRNEVKITDANNKDVTANYEIITTPGWLEIEPVKDEVTVTITGNSGTVTYNGSVQEVTGFTYAAAKGEDALSNSLFEVALADGSQAKASGTDAGTYNMGLDKDDFVVTSANYSNVKVEVVDGWLEIEPVKDEVTVTITGNSGSFVFDGNEHTVEGYVIDIPDNVLVKESDIVFSGEASVSRTDVGFEKMGLSSDDFVSINTNYSNVKFVVVDGGIEITQQTINPEDPDNPDSYLDVRVSEPADVTYNGQHQESPVTVTRVDEDGKVVATLDEVVDYTLTYDNDVNAGEDTASVTVKGIGNYTGSVTKHYTISPAAALITVNDASKVYGDDDPVFTGAITLADGKSPLYTNVLTDSLDTLGDVTYSRDNANVEDAGAYPEVLNAQVANLNSNYTYKVQKGDFTITEADGNVVTITTAAEDRTKVYDGKAITIDAQASAAGSTLLYSTDGQNWSETKPTLTDVGSLTIYVKATNPNYEDSPVVDANVQVTPTTLRVTTPSDTKIFDGTPLAAEGSISGFVEVDGVAETATFETTGSQTEVGESANTYKITWDGTAKESNYTVVEDLGTLLVYPQSIDPEDPDPENPDPDDPSPDDPDPENPDQPFYNGVKVTGPEDVDYNGLSQQLPPTVTDRNDNPLDPNYYDVAYSDDTVNAGTVTITVTGKNGYTGEVQVTYQIKKVGLTITTPDAGKVYDGMPLQNQIVQADGWKDNDASQVTLTANGSITEVGSTLNTYVATDPDNVLRNYNITEDLGTLTVWPQSIDPEDPDPDNPDPDDPDPTDPDPGYDPDDPDPEDPDQPFYTGIKIQGPDPQMYDAADQTPGVVVTDKNGKVLEEGTDYRITGYDNNYNVTTEDSPAIIHVEGMGNYGGSIDVEFEIIPAPLTVTTPSAGKVYDGSALTAGPADVEGLQGSDATAVTITANGTQTDVGNSVNGVSYDWGQVLASNYSITEDLGTLTVWPQSIDPTDPGENPDPDDPDAPDPSDPDPDFPGEDPDPDNPVVPDQPFYTGAEVNAPQDVSYNGTDQTWVPTVTDAEDNLLTAGEDYEVSYSTNDRTNVTGDITVTITGKGNYAGTITREYQITPLEIDVYIENQTKVEGEADPTFTFNYEGVLEGESMGWTGAFVRDAGEAAGTYNVAQGGFVLADNEAGNFLASNYTLTVHPGTLTITAAPVPPGPDDPDPVTPVTPLPTPDPTPVPTPAPGDEGATPVEDTTDEAEEAIDDEATPLTAPEPIDDNVTPMASGAHRDCWVHWLMLLGILVTVVYYGGVGVRRVRFSSSLQSFEDDVLGNDETNR